MARPLGTWLFAAAAPFGLDALTFAVAAALIAGIRPVPVPQPRSSLRGEIVEGVRWLWRHRLLRTLAMSMGLADIA